MKNIIVTGCNGQLGIEINRLLAGDPEYHLINTDVSDPGFVPVDKKLPDHVSVRWHGLPSGIQFLRALDEGKLLYLQLYLHPCYGTHHVLCYGYTAVHSTDSGGKDKEKNRKQREIYLIIADGWNRRPRYLRLKSRGLCNFFAIE